MTRQMLWIAAFAMLAGACTSCKVSSSFYLGPRRAAKAGPTLVGCGTGKTKADAIRSAYEDAAWKFRAMNLAETHHLRPVGEAEVARRYKVLPGMPARTEVYFETEMRFVAVPSAPAGRRCAAGS